MAGLEDKIESNSAAQVPIIDTLQDLANKNPSRYRAEENVREALTGEVYDWLCPEARNAVVTAEYIWLDANFPDPSKIVLDLATAFEIQLRSSIFNPFRSLLASRYKDYPPRSIPASGPMSESARPRPGQPVNSPNRLQGRIETAAREWSQDSPGSGRYESSSGPTVP